MAVQPPPYRVIGPPPDVLDQPWERPAVTCWFCLKPNSVTPKNRAYVPMRAQHTITGAAELPHKADKFGYFDCWNCALAYAKAHFPHLCHRVHAHAILNGFVGLLLPTTDPRYVQTEFHPFIKDTPNPPNLVPDQLDGRFTRRVPLNEQIHSRLPEYRLTLDQIDMTKEVVVPDTFPQHVWESLQQLQQEEEHQDQDGGGGGCGEKLAQSNQSNQSTQPNQPNQPNQPTKRTRPSPVQRPLLPPTKIIFSKKPPSPPPVRSIFADEELSIDEEEEEEEEEKGSSPQRGISLDQFFGSHFSQLSHTETQE